MVTVRKVIIAGITLLLTTTIAHSMHMPNQAQEHYEHLTSNNSIIAFDLHKVLLGQSFPRVIGKLVLRNPKLLLYLLNPTFFKRIISLTQEVRDATKGVTLEKMFNTIAQEYPEPFGSLGNDFIEILNQEPLYTDTVTIAQKLKDQGYKLFLLSNIDLQTWQHLIIKQPVLQELFAENVFIPDAKFNYIKKPAPEFYQKFKDYLAEKGLTDKAVLFIDDSTQNISVAQNAGITGIVFTTAQDLEHQLATYGITLAAPILITNTANA